MTTPLDTTYTPEVVPDDLLSGEQFDGSTTERIYRHDLEPGQRYTFAFGLKEDNPFEERTFTIDGEQKKTLQVNFEGHYTTTKRDGTEMERTIRFQKADFYKSPKMKAAGMASQGERLLGALGYKGALTTAEVKTFLTQADAQRKTFTATVKWRAGEKDDNGTYTAYSTHPRKDEQAWPKGEDGKPKDYVVLPSGERTRGNVDINGFINAPKA